VCSSSRSFQRSSSGGERRAGIYGSEQFSSCITTQPAPQLPEPLGSLIPPDGVGRTPQAAGPVAGIARGGQARFPGLRTTSTRQTMPKTHCAAPELASLLDGSSAGELIPELARHGLQQLIELEVAAVLGG
jgi:hypothetical protein